MDSAALKSNTGELVPGEHVCLIYETEEEHAELLTPYLRAGLARGEKIVYLADYTSGSTLLGYLKKAGMNIQPHLRRGQIVVMSASQAYLPNGVFDPDFMVSYLREATRQAMAEGYTGLRATGEMTWVLEGRPGCDRVLEYESKTNAFFKPECHAVGLCQYRRSRFDAKMLLEILKTHPIAGTGPELYSNPFYIPPELYLGPKEADAMLDRCLAALRTRARGSAN